MLDHRAYLDLLIQELVTYRQALATADLAAPVAACPGWDVSELTRHLGNVHRWAATIVSTGEQAPWPQDGTEQGDQLRSWFAESNQILLDALTSSETGAEGWTLMGAGQRGFWFRRQAQEAFVHRIDLELAVGVRTPSSAELAADGIQEIWDVMMPRIVKRQLASEIAAPVTIHATDAGQSWTLHPGHSVTHDATGVARIEGAAEDLLLLLWKRKGQKEAGISVSGDQVALDSVTEGRLTP